jgi:hypothetical protein
MKRLTLEHKRGKLVSGCCPGHDDYPTECYKSRRSKRARARQRKKENQNARQRAKTELRKTLDG